LALQRGADYFRSEITSVDTSQSSVTTTLRPLVEQMDHNRTGWVASDDDARTFWRATYLGEGRFQLDGPPVKRQAFGDAGVLRLWEFGTGDHVRQSTSVSVRRVEPGVFEVLANVPIAVSLLGHSAEFSTDGQTWREAASPQDGWVTVALPGNGQSALIKIR
jgi:hypothetical protein